MTGGTSVQLRWPALVIGVTALLATGGGAAYLVLRSDERAPSHDVASTSGASTEIVAATPVSPPNASLSEVTVSLSQDAVERAGITVTPVGTDGASAGLRLPGVVEPNAYRQVAVTPLTGGRITRVLVALGEQVRKGQTMAQVFSPELAEAQARYVSARAELEAHERELQRTEKLVEIGAASRQELERIHAEHTAQRAAVQSARSQLELLGVPESVLDGATPGKGIAATTNVPAPIAGIVTERTANAGLNVDPATKLFTVVDLSTVWVVADVYEKDFSRVRVGTPATVTTTAYPGAASEGRISYIDPQVSPETRTAKVRVEVQNPRGELRLGMYAEVLVQRTDGAVTPVIPRSAVQTVGDRQVVYLVNPKQPGRLTEREVRLGQLSGEHVEVLSGVRRGDMIVAEGSFFVRAERERLGLRPATPTPVADRPADPKIQLARVVVGERGFDPAKVSLRAGTPARITFVRTTDNTCAREIVLPSLNITRPLPLNEAVLVELTPAKTGTVEFTCGMKMLRGALVVQ